jgi:pilus assembly protein CpaE
MRAILICPNAELRGTFENMASQYPAVRIAKSLDLYPDADQFRRLVRMWSPDVIFVSMEDEGAAIKISQQLDGEFASIQRIAVHTVEEPAVLRLALELRMAGLLVSPITERHFEQVLKRLADHLALHPAAHANPGQVYAFLPAKGGVGASTIASNAARAFAEVAGSRVLLADFDVSSGVAGFMFNTEHNYSVNDAAIRNKELDEDTWQRLVKRVGNVDLLLSGAPRFDEGIAPEQIPPVLDFARRTYSVVGADVADTFDERTMAVLREANRIFLVTTPDLSSLRLAKLKAVFLRNLEWEDKTRLLLNRVNKKMDLSTQEIEATVGLPVFASFPCAYADVTRSVRHAESSPKLASSIKQFVEKLDERDAPKDKPVKTRFIERFAVVPGRYGFR